MREKKLKEKKMEDKLYTLKENNNRPSEKRI